jgi:Tfp pilus assembly protein FimT
MVWNSNFNRARNQKGFSVAEVLTVSGIVAVLCAIALPQVVSQRRLFRTSAVSREFTVQMRYARQLAMSRRQAFTFQYDQTNNRIQIIGPIPNGPAALADLNYPNNSGSSVLLTVPIAGLSSADLREGIPTTSTGLPAGAPTIPTGPLGDGVSRTSLSSGRLNITFQPDGGVIDSTGAPSNKALFFFNNKAAQQTATAISVIGASGRTKIWRYTTNGNKYAE